MSKSKIILSYVIAFVIVIVFAIIQLAFITSSIEVNEGAAGLLVVFLLFICIVVTEVILRYRNFLVSLGKDADELSYREIKRVNRFLEKTNALADPIAKELEVLEEKYALKVCEFEEAYGIFDHDELMERFDSLSKEEVELFGEIEDIYLALLKKKDELGKVIKIGILPFILIPIVMYLVSGIVIYLLQKYAFPPNSSVVEQYKITDAFLYGMLLPTIVYGIPFTSRIIRIIIKLYSKQKK